MLYTIFNCTDHAKSYNLLTINNKCKKERSVKPVKLYTPFTLFFTYKRKDLDTVATTFQSLFYGYAFHAAVGKSFDPTDLQAQMAGFYQSLCK